MRLWYGSKGQRFIQPLASSLCPTVPVCYRTNEEVSPFGGTKGRMRRKSENFEESPFVHFV